MHHCWWCGKQQVSLYQDIQLFHNKTDVVRLRYECNSCLKCQTDLLPDIDVVKEQWETGDVTFPVTISLPKRHLLSSKESIGGKQRFTIEIENLDIGEHLKRLLGFVFKKGTIFPHRFTLIEGNITHWNCQLLSHDYIKDNSVLKKYVDRFVFQSRGYTWNTSKRSSVDNAWMEKTKPVVPPFHEEILKRLGV